MPPEDEHEVVVHLDRLLAERSMTVTELSEAVGISVANLHVLKNGRAKAIRFSTLTALCRALDCQPGDLFTVPGEVSRPPHAGAPAPAR
ncbi:transcriptional regulator [Catellatospora methionotrophica]|uniref:Transcriptional regulator n=1 Tax=Catellatospora methionotrophica TaxID=121620 RepID=A0A8J3L546_9ACTN|nr:helix-turn-helix transcriptional regulator [Catellatospora methionotrophica]GIG12530.1 transcriptional regulator [Catellatospora methionotrophica]